MKPWLPVVGRAAISAAILGVGLGGLYLMGTPEVPTQQPPPQQPPLVTAMPAKQHDGGVSFEVDGVVVPFREIDIAAQVPGKVAFKSPNCRIGRTVRKGEVLIRIEPDDYELEVRRLTEELAQAEAMIVELDAEILAADNQITVIEKQLEIDARQVKRNEDLMRRSAASTSEVDVARRSELTTRNTLQSLIDQKNLLSKRRRRMESAKALVQANLDQAKLNLSRTEIVSPIDGVVASDNVEQDGYVQTGAAMFVLQDTSRLDVSCKLHMQEMYWLWQTERNDGTPKTDGAAVGGASADGSSRTLGYRFPKTPATVIYELGDRRFAWDAVVDRYDGAGIDNQTRMVPCRVHVDDPTAVRLYDPEEQRERPIEKSASPIEESSAPSLGAALSVAGRDTSPPTLMTGMFVSIRIHANPPIPFVRLPQQAIQPGNTIWTVVDGRLKRKPIEIATSTGRELVVFQHSGGLRAGDLVVTSPLATPVEGMPVRLESEQSAAARSVSSGRPSAAGPPSSPPPAPSRRPVNNPGSDREREAQIPSSSAGGQRS